MNKLLTLVAAVTLTACVHTKTVWHKDGVTPEEERLDLKSCEFEAKKHDQYASLDKSASDRRYRELRDLCLESKGYQIISQETVPMELPSLDMLKK